MNKTDQRVYERIPMTTTMATIIALSMRIDVLATRKLAAAMQRKWREKNPERWHEQQRKYHVRKLLGA
jgi:hypothetical protein